MLPWPALTFTAMRPHSRGPCSAANCAARRATASAGAATRAGVWRRRLRCLRGDTSRYDEQTRRRALVPAHVRATCELYERVPATEEKAATTEQTAEEKRAERKKRMAEKVKQRQAKLLRQEAAQRSAANARAFVGELKGVLSGMSLGDEERPPPSKRDAPKRDAEHNGA
jgi:hypothetical protein